jgi:hypothetical protein
LINYLKGDATNPIIENGNRFIIHVCNNVGGFGAGFARCVRNKWKVVYEKYNKLSDSNTLHLGNIQFVSVGNKDNPLYVVNMIAQNGYICDSNPVPLNYTALSICLASIDLHLTNFYKDKNSIHLPYIGCGLAGGSWNKVSDILQKWLGHRDLYVYKL